LLQKYISHHLEAYHSTLKCHPTLTHLITHPPNLNVTHLNSYSIPSDPLEIGPKLTMDYPLDNPLWFVAAWCAWL